MVMYRASPWDVTSVLNESKEKLLDMLDNRNGGIGTAWMCGYGVYGLWYDNDAAYLNIGKSCD